MAKRNWLVFFEQRLELKVSKTGFAEVLGFSPDLLPVLQKLNGVARRITASVNRHDLRKLWIGFNIMHNVTLGEILFSRC
jgi:hypothetical protein